MKFATPPQRPGNLFQITTETKLKGHLFLQKVFGIAEKNHRLEQINIVVGREAKGARAVVTKKIRIIYPLTNSCDSTDIIKGKRKKERKEGREGGRR